MCLEAAVECGEVPLPGGWAARGSPGGGGAAGTSRQGEAGGCQLGSGAGAQRLADLLQPCPFSPLGPPGFTPMAPDIYASGWRSPLPTAPRPEGVRPCASYMAGQQQRPFTHEAWRLQVGTAAPARTFWGWCFTRTNWS